MRGARAGGIAGVLLALSCGPAQTLPGDALEPIRIGVIMPLSGELGSDGPDWVNGIRLATREINAAGGPLPGRQVQLVILDGETNPDVGRMRAEDLVAMGVAGVIGDAGSGSSIAVYEVTQPAQIPQLSCCSTSPTLTLINRELPESERYFFRTSPPDDLQSVVVGDIAENEADCQNLAILHLDDAYGTPFGEGIEANARSRGINVVARVPYMDGQPRYTTEVGMIAAASPQPDCIALVAFPQSAGIIVRDWNRIMSRPAVTWIGTDGIRTNSIIDEVGDPNLIDNFYGTAPVTDDPAEPANQAFVERFVATFGERPAPFVSNSYDATALLLLGIAAAGSTEGPLVRDGIRALADPSATSFVRAGNLVEALRLLREGRTVNYEGASGPVDVDLEGNVVTDYEVWRFQASTRSFVTVRIVPANSIP